MSTIDLHIHSQASDGTLSPAQLMDAVSTAGIRIAALTDHDTCTGVPDAAARAAQLGIILIPGIEISCGGDKEIHILGYGVDPNCPDIVSFARHHHEERERRAEQMIRALWDAGIKLDPQQVFDLAKGHVGRPHVAQAMVAAGYANSTTEAFQKYLVPGKCAYVPREIITVAEGCRLIVGAGGIPVLAHPMQLKYGEMVLSTLVHAWTEAGLRGIEVYHPSTANHKVHALRSIARQENLLVTGGSDFHGPQVRDTVLGQGLERWERWQEDISRLFTAMGRTVPAL